MKVELLCTGYNTSRRPGFPPEVDVRFILKTETRKVEEIAEALKRLEIFLSDKVNLVRSDGSARCFYCGTKQADEAQTCTQCGAPL